MCTFEIKVILCKCRDPNCKQRTGEIADHQLPEGGHTVRVTQYYRVSAMCLGWFKNTDQNRTILKYGYPEWNANGVQDCRGDKKFVHHRVRERDSRMCGACKTSCVQPTAEERGGEGKGASDKELHQYLDRITSTGLSSGA